MFWFVSRPSGSEETWFLCISHQFSPFKPKNGRLESPMPVRGLRGWDQNFQKWLKQAQMTQIWSFLAKNLFFSKIFHFSLTLLLAGILKKNTKNWALFNPHRPANENRTCSRLLRTPPHHVIYQHDRKNLEIMIVDEIWHLDLILMSFWHFLGPKHVFCVQNYQKYPGDNVAQRDT